MASPFLDVTASAIGEDARGHGIVTPSWTPFVADPPAAGMEVEPEWESGLDTEFEPEDEGFLAHATDEALASMETSARYEEVSEADPPTDGQRGWPAALLASEEGGIRGLLRPAWERAVLLADIAGGQRSDKDLTNKLFFLRHPERKGTRIAPGETALAAEWKAIHDRQVVPQLLTGPYIGPIHKPGIPGAELRKGVPADAKLSPLAISLRGLRKSKQKQPGTITAVVVHNTSRGSANRSRDDKYRRPAVDFALNFYITGTKGFPHYVIDFNGTVYATCDESYVAWHAGWVHRGGAKLFVSGWRAPEWWRRVWAPQGVSTPLNLLPKGARTPNERTIGIELMILPDLRYTPEQYRALARLITDIQRRHSDLRIDAAPSRALLGHEDFSPVTGEGGRDDGRGGWDPGAHRENPYFDWAHLWSEMQTVAGTGATGEVLGATLAEQEFESELDASAEQEFETELDASAERLEPDSPLLEEAPRGFFGAAFEQAILAAQIGAGNVDENDLTNRIFFRRHPELPRTPLEAGQDALMDEWKAIRSQLVQPALQRARGGTKPAAASAHPSTPITPLGTLTFSAPGWTSFSYPFTPYDLEWTVRFLEGEAGGHDNAENRAVLWTMFNRYAYFRNEITSWGSFGDFVRLYSTTLQPYLKSARAALRHQQHCNPEYTNCNYVPMAERHGFYPGTKIPRGQLRQFVALQQRPWDQLSPTARDLASRALRGEIPNPVGTASEFGDTAVYYKDRHGQKPDRAQWIEFTKAFAANKKWVWPSPDHPYDQWRRNVLFVNGRAKSLTQGARILPP